jgi:hypothetical protein
VDVVLFLAAVAVIAAVGIGLGMLVAPRLERLADDPDADDEEPRGDDDRPDA